MTGLIDVIKYEGDNDTFVWKHPKEDFNSMSQLIVHENQEAVFFLNGQALDTFGPGRYTLRNQNIPLLSKVLNLYSYGISPFHSEVYFINKAELMSLRWGTDSRIEFMEPTYHFPLSLGVSGEMSLRASDSRRLLIKVVGTEHILTKKQMKSFFRGILVPYVKSVLAQAIKTQRVSIFEIDEKLTVLSDLIRDQLYPKFQEYGVSLEQFYITNIMKPEGEPQYEKFKELYFRQYSDIAEAKINQEREIINAQTEKITSEVLADEKAADIPEENGDKTDGADEVRYCENCGAVLTSGARFCDRCGYKVPSTDDFGVCSNCGYHFERPGKFCPKCGTPREI